MTSADKHVINNAGKIIENTLNKSKPRLQPNQPWCRTTSDNRLLDYFVYHNDKSFNFTARLGAVTYINTKSGFLPALIFDALDYKDIIRSKHILCPYTDNLANLNEIWIGDWVAFNAKVVKSNHSYTPYLYKLTNIKNPRFTKRASKKLIHCIHKDDAKPNHYLHMDYLIYSNRDAVPQDRELRAGYAISKASIAHVNNRNGQLMFFKRIKHQSQISYINNYSKWKMNHQNNNNGNK